MCTSGRPIFEVVHKHRPRKMTDWKRTKTCCRHTDKSDDAPLTFSAFCVSFHWVVLQYLISIERACQGRIPSVPVCCSAKSTKSQFLIDPYIIVMIVMITFTCLLYSRKMHWFEIKSEFHLINISDRKFIVEKWTNIEEFCKN